MTVTENQTVRNGEEGRSQDLKIDLKLFSALYYICGAMYEQWAVVKQLIETGDTKGVCLDDVHDSILCVEDEIVQLERLLGREELKSLLGRK